MTRNLRSWWRRWLPDLSSALRHPTRRSPWRQRPFLELLEDRWLLSATAYTVSSTADDGSAGTLRAAINAVNAGQNNGIVFNIAAPGQQTIMVGSSTTDLNKPLPYITASNIYINGLNTYNGVTTSVELNGTDSSSYDGIYLAADNNTVSGLTIDNFFQGILVGGNNDVIGGAAAGEGNLVSGNANIGVNIIAGLSGDQVLGNTIGLNAAGTAAEANGLVGVVVDGNGCTIGGTTPGARNYISGNVADGVYVGAADNLIEGNYVGLNTAGTAAVANGTGNLFVDNAGIGVYAPDDTIGGSVAGAGNVISGNYSDGIYIDTQPEQISGVLIQGNYIGTNSAGSAAVANGLYGIQDLSSVGSNTIGGAALPSRNVISGNAGGGVVISSAASADQILGNYIGLTADGSKALANSFGVEVFGANSTIGGTATGAGNVISGNSGDGLLLKASGVVAQGNYIGTDRSGKNALANSVGVEIASTNDTLGSTVAAANNFIAGNSNGGVLIDQTASGNKVLGNYIGINSQGNALGNGSGNGIEVQGSNNTIGTTVWANRNVISGNTGDGVLIDSGASGNQVIGNVVGINVAGNAALANSNGVVVQGSGNTIGGTAAGMRNIIGGNTNDGILFDNGGSGNAVQGNFIGLNSAGKPLGNNNGIEDATGANTIGGAVSTARNFVSGNTNDGVLIDSTASGTLVEGNSIGLNTASNGGAANKNGVVVNGSGNTIGGTTMAARNIISGNTTDGLLLNASGVTVQGNYIGTDISGKTAVSNGTGVEISASGLSLGGTTTAAANFLSGNKKDGVLIDSSASGVTVLGNYIGLSSAGAALANSGAGAEIAGTSNTIGGTIAGSRNVISGNSGAGVLIDAGASGNQVLGNAIGINAPGTAALANKNGIEAQGSGNTIGGTTAAARNFIAGNTNDGILFDAGGSGNTVQGNFIGVNSGGNIVSNGANGVEDAAGGNIIGGTVSGARNIISGNKADGVLIDGSASGSLVQGNYLGVNPAGTTAAANNNGIEIAGSSNTIGGTATAARNIISGNTTNGVLIDSTGNSNQVLGNYVGLNASSAALANGSYGVSIAGSNNSIGGSVSGAGNTIADNAAGGVLVSSGSGNTIRHNAIYANGATNTGPGIVENSGANNNLAAPTLTSVAYNSTTNVLTVSGTFAGTAGVTYVLEFFVNVAGDPEGKIFVGSKTVTPTTTGTVSFTYSTGISASLIASDPLVTSTLTDGSGDTSAFSNGASAS